MKTPTPEQVNDYIRELNNAFNDNDEINLRFTHHPPDPNQIMSMQVLRAELKRIAYIMIQNVPEGRELSLALAKLEEVMMHANSGIVRADARAQSPCPIALYNTDNDNSETS